MKKIILAVSAIVILLSAGSVLAEVANKSGSGAHNKALKLIDATGRDLGYLVSADPYTGGRGVDSYTTYDPDLEVILKWITSSNSNPTNSWPVLSIYYSRPNCTGKAYYTHFENQEEEPDCNTPITIATTFWYRMRTCQPLSTTINSKISSGGECSNFPAVTVNDAYLVDSFENRLLDPAIVPFKVVEK